MKTNDPIHSAAERETAAPATRSWRARAFQIYILVSLILFALLAAAVNAFQVNPLDTQLTLKLQSEVPAWVGTILFGVSWIGFLMPSIIILAVAVLALLRLGLEFEAQMLTLAGVGATLLNLVIKSALRRPRPTPDLVAVVEQLTSYSFPSGHTMFYAAFYGFLAFLGFTLARRLRWRVLATLIPAALVAAVGPSRIYLGEHWASDVIAGYLAGFLVLAGVIWLYRWGKARRVTQQPVAQDG